MSLLTPSEKFIVRTDDANQPLFVVDAVDEFEAFVIVAEREGILYSPFGWVVVRYTDEAYVYLRQLPFDDQVSYMRVMVQYYEPELN